MQPNSRDADFARMVACFEAIAKTPSKTRQRFDLYWSAGYFGIQKAEFRRMYATWLSESHETGGAA